jgi:hypothetical protein
MAEIGKKREVDMLDGEIVQICRQEEEEEEDSCIKQLAS